MIGPHQPDRPIERRASVATRPTPCITFNRVGKRFGELAALIDVSFDVPRGQVLALLGENGAGKTTAMNILAGLYLPDHGHIMVDGAPLPPGSPRASLEAGIGMVHQQFKLIETLTGFENLSLALHRGHVLQPTTVDPQLAALMADLGFDLDLDRAVWQLPFAHRQQLEILRVLAVGAQVLILDEPTSVLSPLETARLFQLLRRIASRGRTVILISHKLKEVTAAADRVIIMRAGQVIHETPIDRVDDQDLASLIVGGDEVADEKSCKGSRPSAMIGDPVLTIRGLSLDDDLGLPAVRNIDLTVRAGELVALIGVAGNGQSELMDAIGGLRPIRAGSIEAPAEQGRRAFAFIPSQHLGTGLAPGLDVIDNAILGHHQRHPFGRWIHRKAASTFAARCVERFSAKVGGKGSVSRLSGGNLQRLILGRELHGEPRLIVASYPTRGLDVGSSAAIRAALVNEANQGRAVLLASEELDETLAIATRVLIMHGGRLVAERDPTQVDRTELGRLLTTGVS